MRHADDPTYVFDDRLGHKPVQSGDPPFGVAKPLTHVRLPRFARRTFIRAADGGGNELAGLEVEYIGANSFDLAEHLVPEHERCLAGWSGAGGAMNELAVGTADADLSHA